jgi:hypothetical protein
VRGVTGRPPLLGRVPGREEDGRSLLGRSERGRSLLGRDDGRPELELEGGRELLDRLGGLSTIDLHILNVFEITSIRYRLLQTIKRHYIKKEKGHLVKSAPSL